MAILLWLILLVASFHGSPAQNSTRTIHAGSRLTANSQNTSSWPSPLGDFAFGFYNLSEDRFLVGIWFDKIPEKTLAWSFNRNQPVGLGSYLELTFSGGLLLKDSLGNETYINDGSLFATSANMQDDGNFVLINSDGRDIWQSFDSPTDTLLPGQILRKNQTLISNANGTIDFSEGRFNLEMQFDGNLLLNAFQYKDPAYWHTGTQGDNGFLQFNATNMLMFVYNTSTPNYHNLTDAGKLPTPLYDYYHRATLNDVGNFQQFYYKKAANRTQVGQSSWSLAWQAILQPCTVNGLCGEYGYCILDANKKPSCLCPPNFTLLDPNNPFKGCYPDFAPQRCGKDSSRRNFTVKVIEGLDYTNNVFADLSELKHSDRESCRKAVMDDCSCMAAVFQVPERTCLKKRMPLLNGKGGTSAEGRIAFIKVATTDDTALPSPDRNKDPSSRDLAAGSIITGSVLIFIFAAGAIYCHLASRPCGLIKPSSITSAKEINLTAFKFSELQEATGGFSRRLGRGAFGTVYSGTLLSEDSQIGIAVKKLEKVMEQGEKEFLTELKVIGRTHHKNLVRLLGYCNEASHRLLVYELMEKGSLYSYLFGDGERPNWGHRVEIAMGIARGLLYLHEECETQIIHCDIKPQNVLIDDHYNAKIADFGLAKLLMKDQTRTSTNARGTAGAMVPGNTLEAFSAQVESARVQAYRASTAALGSPLT
ncbi:hypothetical protein MRB53_012230 [Persea americana]|uniref:Uncharacterized protein n=1 Tax=Persea americana TaxID=3435 RepID=A0ACC2LXM7_PERAE|nr:hypothetical protein MRB53_012230 [Persea americana]